MQDWASALSALCERSQLALRYALAFLTADAKTTAGTAAHLFNCEEDALCLSPEHDYLVVNYLACNEQVGPPLAPDITPLVLPVCMTITLLARYVTKAKTGSPSVCCRPPVQQGCLARNHLVYIMQKMRAACGYNAIIHNVSVWVEKALMVAQDKGVVRVRCRTLRELR
jgi:hypothetical protein